MAMNINANNVGLAVGCKTSTLGGLLQPAAAHHLELGQMAADTFETEDEASAWLRRAHPVLEGDSPLEAAKTSFGAQRVKDILIAIRYGGLV